MAQLDDLLPDFRHRSSHCRPVPAEPATAVRAARQLTVEEVRGMRALLALRALPGLLRGGTPPGDRGMVDLALAYGFGILAEHRDELVLGLIGQPWLPTGGEVARFAGPAEFVAFDRPGFVKVAANFSASPAAGGCVLCTETRVVATDEGSARRFARYWRVIAPAGGWLRRRMLAAAARRCRPH